MQATKLVLHFQMRWHGTAQLRGRRDAIAGVSLSRNRRFFSGQRGSQGRLPGETAFTAAESTPQALQTPDSAEQEASIETVTRSDTDKLRSNVVSTAPMGDGATRMRGTRSSSSSGGRKVQGPGSGSRVSKVCPLPGKEVRWERET